MSNRSYAGSRQAARAVVLLRALPALSLAQDTTRLQAAVDAIIEDGWRIANLEATIELTDAGILPGVRIGRLEVADSDVVAGAASAPASMPSPHQWSVRRLFRLATPPVSG